MNDTDNITQLHQEPQWIIGPFETYHVVINGRLIPNLTARRRGEKTSITVDGRITITVPNETAYQVAAFAADVLAIGAGYSHAGAESKDRPFAPRVAEIDQ